MLCWQEQPLYSQPKAQHQVAGLCSQHRACHHFCWKVSTHGEEGSHLGQGGVDEVGGVRRAVRNSGPGCSSLSGHLHSTTSQEGERDLQITSPLQAFQGALSFRTSKGRRNGKHLLQPWSAHTFTWDYILRPALLLAWSERCLLEALPGLSTLEKAADTPSEGMCSQGERHF